MIYTILLEIYMNTDTRDLKLNFVRNSADPLLFIFHTFFSTLPSTQTIKVIDLFFFNELTLKK